MKQLSLRQIGLLCLCIILYFDVSAQKQLTKVSPDLKKISEKSAAANARVASKADLHALNDLYQFKGDKILIEAFPETDIETLRSDLKRLGLTQENTKGKLVTGFISIDQIENLESLKSLKLARPSLKPVTNIGSVTSQGDISQESDNARSSFGVDGSGVKVGVLSDSYNFLGGANGNIATGDLPGAGNPNGHDIPVEVLMDDEGNDEGRAMMEIIHDVAPGSALAFHTANLGPVNFAQGILDLADAGCDIIVDDITYLTEPYFQDGIIAQAVDSVNEIGVSYFSSAGNRLRSSYESEFRPGASQLLGDAIYGFPIGNYALHDFDPGPDVDYFQEVTIPANGEIIYALQWSDPYASACETCPGAESDLDIFLALEDGNFNSMYFDLSGVDINVGADPFEILGVGVGDEDVTVYIVIGKYLDAGNSPDPEIIKYVDYGFEPVPEYATYSSTITGHHNAAGSNTVGAVRYDRTPAYGVETPLQEIFSSVGGLKIYYDKNGSPISPEDRLKPDFSAVQGGNSTFFGFDYEGDGLNNFFGTSASAPHAAGIAALMKSKFSDLTNEDINDVLESSAIDMDDPFTSGFDNGFDYGTGHGFITATRALGYLSDKPSITSLSFYNSTSDEFIRSVWGALDIATIENGKINVTAELFEGESSWKAKSVLVSLDGPLPFWNKENQAPYSLLGDRNGDLYGVQPWSGSYQVTATPFSRRNARGIPGNSLTKTFDITFGDAISSPVVLTLIDAANDQDAGFLQDGDTIDITEFPQINIRADIQMENVKSAVFKLSGPDNRTQVESLEPYSLFGDRFGDYNAWVPDTGTYVLEVTPYSFYFGWGDAAPTQSFTFKVVNTGNNMLARVSSEHRNTYANSTFEEIDFNYEFNVYPNPSSGLITVEGLGNETEEELSVQVFNNLGQFVYEEDFKGAIYRNLDLSKFGKGMFFVKMKGANFEKVKKITVK